MSRRRPAPRRWWRPRWPQSLLGRVFALYTIALVGFVTAGVALFVRYQFTEGLESAQQRADGLVLVMSPTITESAVIGDYDTLKRTLENAIRHSDFASAEFIDLKGAKVQALAPPLDHGSPPAWLSRQIHERLYETNLTVSVGGRDYGVLRLRFAPERIAGELWRQSLVALALGAMALGGGLVAILVPLRRWLGKLDRLQQLERAGLDSLPVPEDAPIELQRTFETLIRAAKEREAALTALRSVLEGLLPGASSRGGDDLEAITQMISRLTTQVLEHGEHLNAIFQLSPDGFVSFDTERRVNYASPAFTRLTGLSEGEIAGVHESTLLARWHAVSGARPDQLPSLALLRSAGQKVLLTVERPKRRVLELALRSGETQIVSQVLLVRDVTHQTEVDQMKSEFLSTAAHELRTPMASIFGFVELLILKRLSPQRQQSALETVHRQTKLMMSIVDELLDLARIEARRGMDFEYERLDLRAVVEQVVRDFAVPDGRQTPALALPAAAVPVSIDRKKFAQALGNVLSNGYKYSPEGGAVEVSLVVSGTSTAQLTVADRGIGMSSAQLARVCERFWRADASGSIPGTGLGMSVVKEIVELLGGRLSLASEPGAGTQVTFELPVLTVDLAGAAELDAGDLLARRPQPAAGLVANLS